MKQFSSMVLLLFCLSHGCSPKEEVLSSRPVVCAPNAFAACDCGEVLPTGIMRCNENGWAFGECDCDATLTTLNTPAEFVAGTQQVTEKWQAHCEPRTYVKAVDSESGIKRCAVCPLNTISDKADAAECRPLRFTDISVGSYGVCVLREDGSVQCDGGAPVATVGNLQLEQNASAGVCVLDGEQNVTCFDYFYDIDETEIIKAANGGVLRTFSLGETHACGVTEGGIVECWGYNSYGRVSPPENVKFTSITSGWNHSCGVTLDGNARCWGFHDVNQPFPPENVEFQQLSAGAAHTCGLKKDGTVECWGLRCWAGGELGFYDDGLRGYLMTEDPEIFPEGCPLPDPEDGQFARIESKGNKVCGIRENGTVRCWGVDCGAVPYSYKCHAAASPEEGSIFSKIDMDMARTCGLTQDSVVQCWSSVETEPVFIDSDARFTSMAIGWSHYCGLTADGVATCWGHNDFGQASPPEGEIFSQISAGNYHTCGLRQNGTVRCWGKDCTTDGYSGGPHGPWYDGPGCPSDETTFSQIAAAGDYTCGLKADGRVACWGASVSLPADMPRLMTIDATDDLSCGVSEARKLICWSETTYYGDLSESLYLETAVLTDISIQDSYDFCGLKTDGFPVCSGGEDENWKNEYEQTKFSQLSAGGNVGCGLKPDGRILCPGPAYDDSTSSFLKTQYSNIFGGINSVCGIRSYDGVVVCDGLDTMNVWRMP